MLSIRNQLICLSIAMLLVVAFQPDQVNGQMKKKKLLKGLMGASLLKLFKTKKGGVFPIPLPLPLPLPIDWHTQAALMSKNQAPTHVSHQPYAQNNFQMSPIEYADYQNAIAQALSNGNTYSIPSPYSNAQTGSAYSSGGSSNAGENQNDNSGYGSGVNSASNGYDGSSDENSNNNNNNYDNSNSNYENNNGNNNGNNNNYNSGSSSYGVNGVNQNDEYNAYQVSNNENAQSGGYRSAAASSLNPSFNFHFNNKQNPIGYAGHYENLAQYPQNNEPQSQQYNNYPTNQGNGQLGLNNNYEDNSGSASSNSFVATSGQLNNNNYIPIRQVPVYHQSNYQSQSSSSQPQMTSNGWVALD